MSDVYRREVIKQLEIPTFGNHKKVMFYDTLQKLAIRAAKQSQIKQTLNQIKKKVCVLEKISGLNPMLFEQQLELFNIKSDWQNRYTKMVERINQLSSKIDLISQLRKREVVVRRTS